MTSLATMTATRIVVQHGDFQIEEFARGAGPRIVMIPSRDLGASNGPIANITLHDYANDVAAVIAHDGGGPTIVAGHAFGNFVARTTAADYPELVRAVVLLAATHTWPLASELRDAINKSHMMFLPDEVRLRHLQHVFFAPGNDPRVWLGGWNEDVMHAERDATEATPKVEWWTAGTAPVLDVLSLNDPLSPPESTNCYRDQWGADRVEIVSIDIAAHAPLPEQPAAVAEAIIAYMKRLK